MRQADKNDQDHLISMEEVVIGANKDHAAADNIYAVNTQADNACSKRRRV